MANVDGGKTRELSIVAEEDADRATRSGVIAGRLSARGLGCGWLLAASAWLGLTALPSGPSWARHALSGVMAVGFGTLGLGFLGHLPYQLHDIVLGTPKVPLGRPMRRRFEASLLASAKALPMIGSADCPSARHLQAHAPRRVGASKLDHQ